MDVIEKYCSCFTIFSETSHFLVPALNDASFSISLTLSGKSILLSAGLTLTPTSVPNFPGLSYPRIFGQALTSDLLFVSPQI